MNFFVFLVITCALTVFADFTLLIKINSLKNNATLDLAAVVSGLAAFVCVFWVVTFANGATEETMELDRYEIMECDGKYVQDITMPYRHEGVSAVVTTENGEKMELSNVTIKTSSENMVVKLLVRKKLGFLYLDKVGYVVYAERIEL